MPSYPKPNFVHPFTIDNEIAHLRIHKARRGIPNNTNDKLLLGSWNIAKLSLKQSTRDYYTLIAEVLDWFDSIAGQEVNDNLEGLRAIESEMPSKYNVICSDNRWKMAHKHHSPWAKEES